MKGIELVDKRIEIKRASVQSSSEDLRLNSALDHLRSILIEGEVIEAWTVQRRVFALRNRRTIVAATTGRFVALQRGLLGGFDVVDLRWQDLSNAKIQVGIFGARLSLASADATDLASNRAGTHVLIFDGFRKDSLQNVYRLCQAHEQAWREKRRIRDLEELRARSGGVVVNHGGGVGLERAVPQQGSDATRRLQEAKQMLENKLISDAEYEAIKARIITGL